jgi:F420-dependent oxidoreductase-like protein
VRAAIRLGLQIPNFNFAGVEPEDLCERLVEIATAAEASGFDSLFVMDHLHQIPTVGPPTTWMLEGNTTLAALSAVTRRSNLGLMVGGVTYRNPALLAKITTTLDVLSSGRAILGIGAAWFADEHRAYGFDFPPLLERLERLEEAVQIARAMFTQEQASFAGRHYRVENAINSPRPIRGDIPILIGGSGERKLLRTVAQYADASNVFGDVERIRHLVDVLERHCESVGRDPAEITKTRLGTLAIARTHAQAERKVQLLRARAQIPEERLRMMLTVGDPDEVAEQADALIDAGLDGLIFNLPDADDLETVTLAGQTLAALAHAQLRAPPATHPGHPR